MNGFSINHVIIIFIDYVQWLIYLYLHLQMCEIIHTGSNNYPLPDNSISFYQLIFAIPLQTSLKDLFSISSSIDRTIFKSNQQGQHISSSHWLFSHKVRLLTYLHKVRLYKAQTLCNKSFFLGLHILVSSQRTEKCISYQRCFVACQ